MMGGKDQCLACQSKLVKRLKNKHLTVAVEASGGFIQKNYVVICQKNSGQAQTTGLTTRQALAVFRHLAENAVFPAVQQGAKANVSQCCLDSHIRSIRTGQPKVVRPGAMHKKSALA